jgi:hypothetical protein
MTTTDKIADELAPTLREALRQIWLAASYPIRGNEDWRIAADMDAVALERAGRAVPDFTARRR